VGLPESAVPLPARGEATLTVHFDVTPPAGVWGDGGPTVDERLLGLAEVDGRIVLTPVDEAGQALADHWPAQLPFYLLPRSASDLRSPGDRLVNSGPVAGRVQLFPVPDGAPLTDPDEPEVREALDLRHVAARFGSAGPAGGPGNLELGIALGAPLSTAQLTSFELYLDLDRDGAAEYRARTGPMSLFDPDGETEPMRVGLVGWDAAAGAAVGQEALVGSYDYDLYSRVALVRLPASSLGLTEPASFAFYLVHRGLNERWRPGPEFDVAPDGADQAGGPRYVYAPGPEGSAWEGVLAPGGSRTLPRGPLLALWPDNRFEPDAAQFAVLSPDGPVRQPAYLPFAGR
jgi:hypothetical protein